MNNEFEANDRAGCGAGSGSYFADLIGQPQTRRRFLSELAAVFAAGALPGVPAWAQAAAETPALPKPPGPAMRFPRAAGNWPFTSVPVSTADRVVLPPGYVAQLLLAWGDPVSDGPAFRADAGNDADDQAQQAGMHHDGMAFFPFEVDGRPSSTHGLLCINHEYTDDGLLHPDGMETWTFDKVRKSQNATGVSVVEVRLADGRWQVVRPSAYARRQTARMPVELSGPAAGAPEMRTETDPRGRVVFGTLANCAGGTTPWATYLSCEENFDGYFNGLKTPTPEQQRYGLRHGGAGYRWHDFDARFDVATEANEANRFGWVVEIDPRQPRRPPKKRTALGRFKHEGATLSQAADGRVVVYMGDDERFEYLYKFVSDSTWAEHQAGKAAHPLDAGTLYVARFNADGQGAWLPLRHGSGPLTVEGGFRDQAAVLIRTREAADKLAPTRMDRPEWIAIDPRRGDVYCALTGNGLRTPEQADAANPRGNNPYGHILRWKETGADAAAETFAWEVFVLGGDPAHAEPAMRGSMQGDGFANPDGLAFDPSGALWVCTDVSPRYLNQGAFAVFGNNQVLRVDPISREARRFLVGPRGAEITGLCFTPDGQNLLVNIQHPGEVSGARSDPKQPTAHSAWPANQFPEATGGRPRSATLVIRREE